MKRLVYLLLAISVSLLTGACGNKSNTTSPANGVGTLGFEFKATILAAKTEVEVDSRVRLDAVHNAGIIEKITWYFDNGSEEVELQSDISPVLIIENFSQLNAGVYRIEVFVDGTVVADDTLEITLISTPTDNGNSGSGSSSGNSFLEMSAQSTGVVKNVFEKGADVFVKASHDYSDFDSFKWFFDDGNTRTEIVGQTSKTLALTSADLTDSGEYEVEIKKDGSVIDSASFLINIVELEPATFTSCAADPAACPAAIEIPTGSAVHNCPAGMIATSCNGKQEAGCQYSESDGGFKCTDEGDGNGCFLYCQDVATSPVEKTVIQSGGFMDFFQALQFDESDGEVSCPVGSLPTGCSGYEDQTCEPTTQHKYKCEDNGGGDDEGCQLFCWQVAKPEAHPVKTIEIDGGETKGCEDGYIPTGCSGHDEDFCRPKADGKYKCVDDFFGLGCQLSCLKI